MKCRRLAVALLVAVGLSACQATDTPAQRAQRSPSPTAVTTPSTSPAPAPATTASTTAPATASATATTPAPACPGTACITITVTGDVLLHPPLWAQAHRDAAGRGGYDFTGILAAQRPLLAASDLAFCHLETPLAPPSGPFRGYPSFSVPPQIVTALRRTGYDACTTASNHTMDAGPSGVQRTLDDLDAAGLRHTGSARSEHEAARVLTFDVRGTRVALLSYTYGLNGITPDHPWRVNLMDGERIRRDAHAAHRAGADVVVVALHWGTEYQHDPTAQQRSLADDLLADPDIDLVYGHHAHVVQPVQRLHGKWVIYGLGNAIAAQSTNRPDTYRGLLVRVQLLRDAFGHWRAGRLDWLPSGIATTPAYRWTDLSGAPSAVAVTRRYVERLGAARAGAKRWGGSA